MVGNLNSICIIPSGKPKIWDKHPDSGPVKASEAYTGTFHRLCQQYARLHYEEWLIISPKYGLLAPDDIVYGTYDLSFSHIKENSKVISVQQMRAQVEGMSLHDVKEVIMLGGKKFKPIMEALFDGQVKMRFPLHGLRGIGDMQKILKNAISHNEIL